MEQEVYREMMQYYNVKADSFDNYWDKSFYPDTEESHLLFYERRQIDEISRQFGKGHCLDLGCGTSHWLQFYYNNCSQITLVDQSEQMLLQSKNKVRIFDDYISKVTFLQTDIFDIPIIKRYDSIVIGNILSHLTDALIDDLFTLIGNILKTEGSIFITDSLFHDKVNINIYQIREVDSMQFKIYKRYFKADFIKQALQKVELQFFGKYFFGLIVSAL